jgi:hypothetical protein
MVCSFKTPPTRKITEPQIHPGLHKGQRAMLKLTRVGTISNRRFLHGAAGSTHCYDKGLKQKEETMEGRWVQMATRRDCHRSTAGVGVELVGEAPYSATICSSARVLLSPC